MVLAWNNQLRIGTLGGWDGRPGTSSTCSKEAECLLTGAEKRIRRLETPGPGAVCQVPCTARRGAAKWNQRVSYLSGRRILVRVWVVKVSFRIRADDDDDDDLDGGYKGTPLALQLGRGAWQTWDHPTTAWHRGARTISQGLSRSPTESPAGKHQISTARLYSLV
ncbi:hypothetical protein CPLU01_09553 [Colletotrichum plurivorum]|uniref:Uncharacterized protein n=1 Tax=Colletotrichum plurivorum TaxID=2175906 RepID=A0A8H6K7R2_9PEZI|nr:hypothetical protein CPLU01_09553 [Colletotrichum plurivorum]